MPRFLKIVLMIMPINCDKDDEGNNRWGSRFEKQAPRQQHLFTAVHAMLDEDWDTFKRCSGDAKAIANNLILFRIDRCMIDRSTTSHATWEELQSRLSAMSEGAYKV